MNPQRGDARVTLLLVLLAAAMFLIRLTGPPDLMNNDQERPASYVMDAVVNGNWVCQTDDSGDITSKPPLWTWIGAVLSLPFGVNLVTIWLPGALATLGSSLLVHYFGRRRFGEDAAFAAALMVLVSQYGFKQIALARTDAVFALMTFALAVMLYRAWRGEGSWLWFWLFAALSTLTKGPLGLLLAVLGLVGVRRERKPIAWGPMLGGIAMFLVLCGGWFFLAYLEKGQPLIDKMIGRELVGHVVESGKGDKPFSGFYKPTLYFLSRFAPWGLLTIAALWGIWKRRGSTEPAAPELRFLAAYFLGGLVVFSIAPHQRPDLLLPLVPAAALLAGVALVEWIGKERRLASWHWKIATGLTIVALAGFTVSLFTLMAKARDTQRTLIAREFAATVDALAVSTKLPVIHGNVPYAFQFFRGTMELEKSRDEIGEVIGPDFLLVVRDDKGTAKIPVPGAVELAASREAEDGWRLRAYRVSR